MKRCNKYFYVFRAGYAEWRDGLRPTTILTDICLKDGRGKPNYNNSEFCSFNGYPYEKNNDTDDGKYEVYCCFMLYI